MTPTLSPENQQKAVRKIAINGAMAMVMYLLSTVSSSWGAATTELTAVPTMGNLGLWVAQVPLYAAILATVAAFVWPLVLMVSEERERAQRTVCRSERKM